MCPQCLDLLGLLRLALDGWASFRNEVYPPEIRNITPEQLIADPSIPEPMKEWLRSYAADPSFGPANNPPSFVTNEGCWEKAKRAAEHAGASDVYAFANYWYQENC